ncbi:MAG: nucleotidyltransferase family protein [Chloroflexi bacterium]|nr:nucleotidyltransferase family protein [Chloroflexota bacterium]
MEILDAVRECAPPDWFVGAGIIRNIVWDYLQEYERPTPVRDIDVAYYDPDDLTPERDISIQRELTDCLPGIPWEVTNQAAVHLWYEKVFGNAVPALTSIEEAISTWPETATCIGVRLLVNNELVIVAPYGLEDLFQMILRRNPKRVSKEQFRRRVEERAPTEKWPKVRVIYG